MNDSTKVGEGRHFGVPFEIHIQTFLEHDNPRDNHDPDSLVTLVTWDGNYHLGDERPTVTPVQWIADRIDRSLSGARGRGLYGGFDAEEVLARYHRLRTGDSDPHGKGILTTGVGLLERAGWVFVTLYLFDHSGLSLSTDPSRFAAVDGRGWDWGPIGWGYCPPEKIREAFGDTGQAARLKAAEAIRSEVEEYHTYISGDIYYVAVDGEATDFGLFGFEEAERAAKESCREASARTWLQASA